MQLARSSGARCWAAAVSSAAFVVLMMWTAPAAAQTPTPTPGGDCCTSHDGPSCDTPACQACVCDASLDPECCTGVWDATCAEEAANECSASCPACPTPTPTLTPTPGGDCCSAHDGPNCDDTTCSACMCDLDPDCCNGSWDDICAAEAATNDDDPNGGCRDECPCKGNCCVSQGQGDGCEDDACTACVCNEEMFCCTDSWDSECVERANDDTCGDICACGGLPGDCCTGNATAGCGDQECQDCVCGQEPFCCDDVWDDECAARAANMDDGGCGSVCQCTGDQACCFPHSSGGCNNDDCENCVADIEPSCKDQWDVVCVERALTACPDLCACGPTPAEDCCVEHADQGCEEDSCEQCVCNLDPTCCGEDPNSPPDQQNWDLTCVDEASNSVECTGQCLCQPRALDDCCVEETDGGCSNQTCQQCVCNIDSDCCNLWDRQCASEAANECFDSCGCQRPCVGDCFGQGFVSVSDLVTGLNILLGNLPFEACPAFGYNGTVDTGGNPVMTVDELVGGVDAALNGCR